uniref:(northern house mosquito) hypothetical protein n=1 Tax=Culex pipiens TaxID=7175 RepID=A0A8D8C0N4_CULPI
MLFRGPSGLLNRCHLRRRLLLPSRLNLRQHRSATPVIPELPGIQRVVPLPSIPTIVHGDTPIVKPGRRRSHRRLLLLHLLLLLYRCWLLLLLLLLSLSTRW